MRKTVGVDYLGIKFFYHEIEYSEKEKHGRSSMLAGLIGAVMQKNKLLHDFKICLVLMNLCGNLPPFNTNKIP